MLGQLTVKDYAVVKALTVSFLPGLTVITGDTGAGKSILLTALGLALGDRAAATDVRPGAERAEVIAEFNLTANGAARDWLQHKELDDSDSDFVVLRRTLTPDGRSRAYINGRPAPAQDLSELAEHLLDIHGQHAHQALLKRHVQLAIFDAFAQLTPLAEKVRAAHQTWQRACDELHELLAQRVDDKEQEWLEFQLREVTQLAGGAEYDTVSSEHRRLASADALLQTVQQSRDLLALGETDATSLIRLAMQGLQRLVQTDAQLNTPLELIETALVHLGEADRELEHYANRFDPDPQRLTELDQLLGRMHDVARKHRVPPQQLADVEQQLTARLEALQRALQARPQLEEKINATRGAFETLAQDLSKKRRKAAPKFNSAVSQQIRKLGMPAAEFLVHWHEQESHAGLESADFHVTTNPRLPAGPLNRVASGGELSRISLAIQVIAAESTQVPTLILDEADVGVGGAIAEVVGKTIRDLAQRCQIVCITHVPQVAVQGHHHAHVSKDDNGTRVQKLDAEDRIQEIARMIGGARLTEKTVARAEEMLRLANEETA